MTPSIHLVEGGACEFAMQCGNRIGVNSGDVVLIFQTPPPINIDTSISQKPYCRMSAESTENRTTTILSAIIGSESAWTSSVLSLLPSFVHVVAKEQKNKVIAVVVSLFESAEVKGMPGSIGVISILMTLIATEVLQEQLRRLRVFSEGWSSGLQHPQVGKALAEMLLDPSREWTVESLSSVAQMSRSLFSQRFREVLGRSPIEVLTSIRITAACELLRADYVLKEIAAKVGYKSASALSVAFRRQLRMTPIQYRQTVRCRSANEP